MLFTIVSRPEIKFTRDRIPVLNARARASFGSSKNLYFTIQLFDQKKISAFTSKFQPDSIVQATGILFTNEYAEKKSDLNFKISSFNVLRNE